MLVCNWGNISGSQNGSLPISEHLLNVVCLKCAVNMCGTTSTRNLRLRNVGKRTHERASRKTRGGDSQPRHCLVWRACIVFTFTCAHSESCDYPVAALYLCVGSCSSKSNRLFVRTLRNVIWIAVERQVDECLSRISLRKRRTNCTRHILRIQNFPIISPIFLPLPLSLYYLLQSFPYIIFRKQFEAQTLLYQPRHLIIVSHCGGKSEAREKGNQKKSA